MGYSGRRKKKLSDLDPALVKYIYYDHRNHHHHHHHIIIRHELGLNKPVTASYNFSSNASIFVFVHLVYNSVLSLASCFMFISLWSEG